MSHRTVLITGATGLLGNNLVRRSLEGGHRVRVLVREPRHRGLRDVDVEAVEGDVRSAETIRRACRGADAVLHAAAVVRIGRTGWEEARAVNVEGTRHVAAAARECGARMVHVSTCDCIAPGTPERPGDEEAPLGAAPPIPYVATKREAEDVVQEQIRAGLEATIVNPAYMLGPWDWKPSSGEMLLQVGRGRAYFAPGGWISLCDVRDVADGVLAALERGAIGRRYVLAGRNMPLVEAWRHMARIAGVRGPIGRMGPLALGAAGLGGDVWTRLTGREPVVNSAAVRMSRQTKAYSSRRAQAELGYVNRPLEDTLRDAWNWFREQGYVAGSPLRERAG